MKRDTMNMPTLRDVSAVIIIIIVCCYVITVRSNSLCTDASESGFDVQNLIQNCSWMFSLPESNCSIFNYSENNPTEPCNVKFTVCDYIYFDNSSANAYLNNSKMEKPLGNFSDYVLIDNGFSINTSSNASDNRPNLQLDFICDHNTTLDKCSHLKDYNVTFNDSKVHAKVAFAGACTIRPTVSQSHVTSTTSAATTKPTTTAIPTTNSPEDDGLSTGSILLIIFFVALALYLIGGIIWNHAHGARGIEIIPNLGFWQALPGYIMDGFIFFFTLMTCGPCRESKAETYDRM